MKSSLTCHSPVKFYSSPMQLTLFISAAVLYFPDCISSAPCISHLLYISECVLIKNFSTILNNGAINIYLHLSVALPRISRGFYVMRMFNFIR